MSTTVPARATNWRRKLAGHVLPFHLPSFLAGERLRSKNRYQLLNDLNSYKNCICVGAGPSLDKVNLDAVSNSVVLLLNASVNRHFEFANRGNRIIWFCIDIKAIWRMIDKAPKEIPKVFSANKYNRIDGLEEKLRPATDIFLQPLPSLRKPSIVEKTASAHLSIWPKLFFDIELEKYHWDIKRRIRLGPSSVMFTAIFFALHFRFSKIITLGLDLPRKTSDFKYAESCTHDHPLVGFDANATNAALMHLRKLADFRNVALRNASPLTNDTILPVFSRLEDAIE